MNHLLLIEDDVKLAGMLKTYLGERGFMAQNAPTLEEARKLFADKMFDIVILDLMLPDGDGIDFCREIRETSTVPILMLTARGDEMDRIVGLELGADDYLPKPFNPRELVARLRAILRRTVPHHEPVDGDRVIFGDVEIDFNSMEALKGGKKVELTAYQFKILKVLIERSGRVQSREQLLDAVRGVELEAFDRSIDVHISRIRTAIENDPKNPKLIKTVRGVGYIFIGETDRPKRNYPS